MKKFFDDEYTSADKRAFYETPPTVELEECQNCGRACEELIYLEGWDFRACPTCARECQLTDEAERLCPTLYAQIIAANGVQEIEAVFKAHPDSQCVHCGLERKTIQTASQDLGGGDSARCDGEVA